MSKEQDDFSTIFFHQTRTIYLPEWLSWLLQGHGARVQLFGERCTSILTNESMTPERMMVLQQACQQMPFFLGSSQEMAHLKLVLDFERSIPEVHPHPHTSPSSTDCSYCYSHPVHADSVRDTPALRRPNCLNPWYSFDYSSWRVLVARSWVRSRVDPRPRPLGHWPGCCRQKR